MNLGQWLKMNNLPNVPGSEQFIVGQVLTIEEAYRVRRLVKRAFLDSEGLEILSEQVEFEVPLNMLFLSVLMNLIKDGYLWLNEDKWKDTLCDTMTSDDMLVINSALAQSKKEK